MRRLLNGALCLALLGSACGDPDGLAFTGEQVPTTLIARPSVTFDSAEQDLVIFHAAWLCEFQRRTFGSSDEGQEALEEQLRRSGVALDDYEGFLARLGDSQDHRDMVLYQYQESCLR